MPTIPDFKHSDTGIIRCPYHNQREAFSPGSIIQPTDPLLVRYPCGYVDGLAQKMGMEPAIPLPGREELVQELANRLRRLEERPYSRPVVPKMESRPTQPSTPKEPTILEQYGTPDK